MTNGDHIRSMTDEQPRNDYRAAEHKGHPR